MLSLLLSIVGGSFPLMLCAFSLLGIGNDFARGGQVDFVLGGFTPEECEKMDERIGMAADFVRCFALEGIQRAMNKYNGK